MALRPDREEFQTDISFFCNNEQERGGVLGITATASSGAAMDQAEATVNYVAEPSGVKAIGVLLNDVVNLDLTRQHMNWHKDEVQLGGKVTTMKKGFIVTNWIYPGHTPSPGDTAYVGHSGRIANSDVATDDVDSTGTSRIVGMFLSGKDQDGYAKVEVNLPRN